MPFRDRSTSARIEQAHARRGGAVEDYNGRKCSCIVEPDTTSAVGWQGPILIAIGQAISCVARSIDRLRDGSRDTQDITSNPR